jgi:hypothetical protein
MTGRELREAAVGFSCHMVAVLVGLAMMIVGVAMGVTIVLLPFGVPVGFIGLGLCIWGFFGSAWDRATPPRTPPLAR